MALQERFHNTETISYAPFPEKWKVSSRMLNVMQRTAIATKLKVDELTEGRVEKEDLTKEEKNRRTLILDPAAAETFEFFMESLPFQNCVVDGEGAKEISVDKLGIAMPKGTGLFGNGSEKVDSVVDVIEQTGAACHGRENAISIIGITTNNGLKKIEQLPDGSEPYFRKLFAPKEFNGIVSLEKPIGENIRAITKLANIPSENITLAIMNRPCNENAAKVARQEGANVTLIEAGDLAWCLKAIMSDPKNPTLMYGRGGSPEGSIAAVAARAMGAVGQLRKMENSTDETDKTTIWEADDFVPGKPEHSLVIFSAITDNTHFGLSRVKKSTPNHYFVESAIIDNEGFHKRKTLVHYLA